MLGNYVRDDVTFNTIQLVSENAELQGYVAHESWAALKASLDCYSEKQPLTQVISLTSIVPNLIWAQLYYTPIPKIYSDKFGFILPF